MEIHWYNKLPVYECTGINITGYACAGFEEDVV